MAIWRAYQLMDLSHQVLTGDAMLPFAYDEWQCRRVGLGAVPTVHLWRHARAFILGMRDRRLSYAESAMARMARAGESVIVRHSGGAAVPLDEGVLNVSLIYPRFAGRMDIHDDFEWMVHLLKQSLGKDGDKVEVGEVTGAYCPGSYDLGVNGLKFCGLAQRRQTRATIVQAFINVGGIGEERTDRVRSFYHMSTNDGGSAHDAPTVVPGRVTSLVEAGYAHSMETFTDALKRALQLQMGTPVSVRTSYEAHRDELEQMSVLLHGRYDR